MGYAFISYSSLNREAVEQLRNILHRNNIDTWIAPDDIPPGSKYAQVINRAIKHASCVILLLTQASLESQWVSKEIERAIHYNRLIVSIKLEDIVLTDEFELYISTDQRLSISSFEDESPDLRRLISTAGARTRASAYTKADLEQEIIHEGNAAPIPIPVTPAPRPVAPAAPPVSASSGSKAKKFIPLFIAGGCTVLLLFSLLFVFVLSNVLHRDRPDSQLNTQGIPNNLSDTAQQAQTSPVQEDTPAPSTETTQPAVSTGINEIPAEYEDKITALMHSDELALRNATIYVKVGSYATPPACIVWTDSTILSQNTAIAIGEGLTVKGISPGTTYILITTRVGATAVYRVICE